MSCSSNKSNWALKLLLKPECYLHLYSQDTAHKLFQVKNPERTVILRHFVETLRYWYVKRGESDSQTSCHRAFAVVWQTTGVLNGFPWCNPRPLVCAGGRVSFSNYWQYVVFLKIRRPSEMFFSPSESFLERYDTVQMFMGLLVLLSACATNTIQS